MLNMFDGDAKVVQTADGLIPDELLGLDRFEARKRVVELIDGGGPARAGRGPGHPDALMATAPAW